MVTVGETTATFRVADENGAKKGVSKSSFTVVPGDTVTVDVSGLEASAAAEAWLVPDEVRIGDATMAGGAGSIAAVIPEGSTEGDRQLVVVSSDSSGNEIVIAQGLRIATSGTSKNRSTTPILVGIVGLGILAGFLIPVARRRRDDEEEASTPRA